MTGLPDGRDRIKDLRWVVRARPTAMAGVLMRLGFDSETLRKHASLPVLGLGGRLEVRPCAELKCLGSIGLFRATRPFIR